MTNVSQSSGVGSLIAGLAERARYNRLAKRCASIGKNVRVLGHVHVHGDGDLFIGDDVELDGRTAAIELHCQERGVIVLGQGVKVQSGVSIEALLRIEVGDGTVLCGYSKVLDNNFHPLSGDRHETRPPSIPVAIGKNCVVGWRAILLPGAQLGDGTRLCPSVVVSRRVPGGVTVAGSPPRLLQAGARE
jgi:acetyltransferase-like isoleucine patch superfamily enzyme